MHSDDGLLTVVLRCKGVSAAEVVGKGPGALFAGWEHVDLVDGDGLLGSHGGRGLLLLPLRLRLRELSRAGNVIFRRLSGAKAVKRPSHGETATNEVG